jgi:hypothetical protein
MRPRLSLCAVGPPAEGGSHRQVGLTPPIRFNGPATLQMGISFLDTDDASALIVHEITRFERPERPFKAANGQPVERLIGRRDGAIMQPQGSKLPRITQLPLRPRWIRLKAVCNLLFVITLSRKHTFGQGYPSGCTTRSRRRLVA